MAKLDHERPNYNTDNEYVDSNQISNSDKNIVRIIDSKTRDDFIKNTDNMTTSELVELFNKPIGKVSNSNTLKKSNARKRAKRNKKGKR